MILKCGNVYVYFCKWLPTPHDKIALCVSEKASWFFWFNSVASTHGHGQLRIAAKEHPACPRTCFLDMSGIQRAPAEALQDAKDRGAISDPLRARILAALQQKIATLPDLQRLTVLRNLTPAATTSPSTGSAPQRGQSPGGASSSD